MSIQSEITRLESAKSAIAAAIAGKGVTVPAGTMLDGMAALIEAIGAGGGASCYLHTFTPAENISDGSLEIGESPIGELDFYLIQTPSGSHPVGDGYLGVGISNKISGGGKGCSNWYRHATSTYATKYFSVDFVKSGSSPGTGVYIENGKLFLQTEYYNISAGNTTYIIYGCI